MAAITICSDFGAPKNKVCHCFPIYFPWSDGTRCHDLSFLNAEPTFSLSSFTFITFTFIKRLFSSSSLSAIRMVSSAYLRLWIFLPAILIPACASSSPVFLFILCIKAPSFKKRTNFWQEWAGKWIISFLLGPRSVKLWAQRYGQAQFNLEKEGSRQGWSQHPKRLRKAGGQRFRWSSWLEPWVLTP